MIKRRDLCYLIIMIRKEEMKDETKRTKRGRVVNNKEECLRGDVYFVSLQRTLG